MAEQSSRPEAREIYGRVMEDARDELERQPAQLGYSGLLAGATVGLSSLASALVLASGGSPLVAALFYPIGFLAVILGRAQLFTENTLYPVALVLEERRRDHLVRTARLWAIVLAANLVGALLFAVLAINTEALPPAVTDELVAGGADKRSGDFSNTFWSAVVGGWLLALVAWLVEATETAIGQAAVIWSLTFLVGFGGFDHSVASATEVYSSAVEGTVQVSQALGWTAAAVLGNVAGGVLIVTLLEYGQARGG